MKWRHIRLREREETKLWGLARGRKNTGVEILRNHQEKQTSTQRTRNKSTVHQSGLNVTRKRWDLKVEWGRGRRKEDSYNAIAQHGTCDWPLNIPQQGSKGQELRIEEEEETMQGGGSPILNQEKMPHVTLFHQLFMPTEILPHPFRPAGRRQVQVQWPRLSLSSRQPGACHVSVWASHIWAGLWRVWAIFLWSTVATGHAQPTTPVRPWV